MRIPFNSTSIPFAISGNFLGSYKWIAEIHKCQPSSTIRTQTTKKVLNRARNTVPLPLYTEWGKWLSNFSGYFHMSCPSTVVHNPNNKFSMKNIITKIKYTACTIFTNLLRSYPKVQRAFAFKRTCIKKIF